MDHDERGSSHGQGTTVEAPLRELQFAADGIMSCSSRSACSARSAPPASLPHLTSIELTEAPSLPHPTLLVNHRLPLLSCRTRLSTASSTARAACSAIYLGCAQTDLLLDPPSSGFLSTRS
jgi:hypothetical protein